MVRRNFQTVSDERVRAATGERRDHWFGLLDEAGARDWNHPVIASFLRDRGVSAWWSQSITVAYEQERGLRQPGQRPDGTFDANVSRTLPGTVAALWPHLADDAARASWLGPGWVVTGETVGSTLRLTAPDGSRAVVGIEPPRASGARGAGGTVRVVVQHGKLPDPAAVERAKQLWSDALGRLAGHQG